MSLLLALFLSLIPISVFAELPTPPPIHPAPQGWNVIPDGNGGVTYWRGQGGTDAYTAQIIGQGLSKMSQPSPAPRYSPPPLTVPDFSSRPRYQSDSDIGHEACVTLGRC
jgi:hypothetical protein